MNGILAAIGDFFDAVHSGAITVGTYVYEFFANMNGSELLQVLKIVGVGLLGIFVVTLAIIGVVTLLNKLGSK